MKPVDLGPPLHGVVVLELGQRIGASVCASLLAQLGAEVLFVEPSNLAMPQGSKNAFRATLSAGKRSLVIDAGRPADARLVERLGERASIVITSSDLDGRLGSTLAARPAAQIRCDVTAFGADGPMTGSGWSEPMVQAISGVMSTTGQTSGDPLPIPLPLLEFMAGAYAAASVLVALRNARTRGRAQSIDVAMFDCGFHAMSTFLPQVLAGVGTPARRAGNRHAMASPWNVYRATDGWVLVCSASDVQWQRMCRVMDRPELIDDPRFALLGDRMANNAQVDEAVQAWIGQRDTDACVQSLSGASIACGPIATIDGYPRERNIEHRGMTRRVFDPQQQREVHVPSSPLRFSVTASVSPTSIPSADDGREWARTWPPMADPIVAQPAARDARPLAGLRVIEIGHYTTVPLATRHLASLGADVIKIEPPGGEAVRAWTPVKHGLGVFFAYTNAGKKSLVLDLRQAADASTLRRLIESADVVIENLKPGALARAGFGVSELLAINPRVVCCSVSGFGVHSLYQGRPAFDTVIQAMSGIMDVLRDGELPLKTGPSSADIMGGELALVALLGALEYRDRAGVGQAIDLSMQDIAAWMTQTRWNDQPDASPGQVLPCSDGFVFAETPDGGIAVTQVGSDRQSREQRLGSLVQAGVRAASLNTPIELATHPQTTARRLWARHVAADGEVWPVLQGPLGLVETPASVGAPMGPLDHDRSVILASIPGVPCR